MQHLADQGNGDPEAPAGSRQARAQSARWGDWVSPYGGGSSGGIGRWRAGL